MSDVKWIKIVTDIFDDEKIRFIETMPEGDTLALLWFRLLCLAGKSNCGGLLMMTDRIAYTEDMLSSVFNRDVKIIRLALETFERLSMIEIVDNAVYITNWEKHQNAAGLDKIREQTRQRVAAHRSKKLPQACNVTVTLPVTHGNGNVTQQNKNKIENKSSRSSNGGGFSLSDTECDDLLQNAQQLNATYDLLLSIGFHDTSADRDRCERMVADYTAEWVQEAIRRTIKAPPSARSWRYIEKILRNWREAGGMDSGEKEKPVDVGRKAMMDERTRKAMMGVYE